MSEGIHLQAAKEHRLTGMASETVDGSGLIVDQAGAWPCGRTIASISFEVLMSTEDYWYLSIHYQRLRMRSSWVLPFKYEKYPHPKYSSIC